LISGGYITHSTRIFLTVSPEFAKNKECNEFLVTVPEPRKVSEASPLFARTLVGLHVHERGSVVFPREINEGFSNDREGFETERYANISEAVWRKIGEHFGLTAHDPAAERRWTVARDSQVARTFVGKLFRVGFAILHAPAYQAEHKSALSADWAHLPIPKDKELFEALVAKGEQVARLLDANRDAYDVIEAVLGSARAALIGPLKRADGGNLKPSDLKITITYWGGGKGRWKPRAFGVDDAPDEEWGLGAWGERTGDLYINDDAFFAHVPEAVWTYQLGGYPVLKKWLGYRQADRRDGNPLTDEERKSFRKIIQRIGALLALGSELDELYQLAAADAFKATELGIER
jgi:Type ISP C-terminal specificity domain